MKLVAICGHFGFGKDLSNGQTIKTCVLCEAMKYLLGEESVTTVDTHGGAKRVPGMILDTYKACKKSKNIIILPAYKGLMLFAPMCAFYNLIFHRKLYYVVVGGWLSEFLKRHHWLKRALMRFDGIFVETKAMRTALEQMGFTNVEILPNCKSLPILREEELPDISQLPYKLCTFSRVMKEKGIEIAMNAVQMANRKIGAPAFTLDIYGPIWKTYAEEFPKVLASVPSYITYKGEVPFDKSTDALKDYTALLFPTYYEGEGFAGTLIDAMAAGVPVLASDWKYNAEIVKSGATGYCISECDEWKLSEFLLDIYQNHEQWCAMRLQCLCESHKYAPEIVYKDLADRLLNC